MRALSRFLSLSAIDDRQRERREVWRPDKRAARRIVARERGEGEEETFEKSLKGRSEMASTRDKERS